MVLGVFLTFCWFWKKLTEFSKFWIFFSSIYRRFCWFSSIFNCKSVQILRFSKTRQRWCTVLHFPQKRLGIFVFRISSQSSFFIFLFFLSSKFALYLLYYIEFFLPNFVFFLSLFSCFFVFCFLHLIERPMFIWPNMTFFYQVLLMIIFFFFDGTCFVWNF